MLTLSDATKRAIVSGQFVESATFEVYRLTRRQREVMRMLDRGGVLELMRLRNTKAKRVAKNYVLRVAGSHETDGAVVMGTTVRALIKSGFAIRVEYPHAGKVWVFSQAYYLCNHANP